MLNWDRGLVTVVPVSFAGVDSLDETRFCFSLGRPLHFETCCCSAATPISNLLPSSTAQITMDVSLQRGILPWRPFPKGNIFDPVLNFDPDQTCETLKRGASKEAFDQISNLCFRVSALLCHVNTLSWLYVLWLEKMDATGGTLSEEDKSMTTILIQMHDHIDTGKRFNDTRDQKDPLVDATRVHDLGFTGVSLDDFKGYKRAQKSSFKSKFKVAFDKWKYSNLKMFS